MSTDAIDLKYAKQVAEFIGAEHTEVIITKQDVLNALEDVVALLGTYDITTVSYTHLDVYKRQVFPLYSVHMAAKH